MDDPTRARVDELVTAVAEGRMSVGHALAQAELLASPEPEPEPAEPDEPAEAPE